jgi:Fur family transcriptional regulator, ferric uptake regulator
MESDIKSILKQQGFTATKTRLSVFTALTRLQPVTMHELISALPHMDRATVYRTVDLFVDLNIAKKVSTGFNYRVELSENFLDHHHHLTCLRCGTVIDIKNSDLEYMVEQSAVNNGFRPVRHDLEISGYCANCS